MQTFTTVPTGEKLDHTLQEAYDRNFYTTLIVPTAKFIHRDYGFGNAGRPNKVGDVKHRKQPQSISKATYPYDPAYKGFHHYYKAKSTHGLTEKNDFTIDKALPFGTD